MNFDLTPTQRDFQQAVRDVLGRERTPERVRQWDETEEFPWDFRRTMADLGWFGLSIPEEWGGLGGDAVDLTILMEELGAADGGFFQTVVMGAQSILHFGSDAHKADLLPRIARGELYIAMGLTEPESGSDAAALQTRASPDGDGGFVLHGQKMWTSGAGIADYIIIVARTNPDPAVLKHRGLSNFLVRRDSAGLGIQKLRTLGFHCSGGTYSVFLDDVHVPGEALLGELDRGWYHIVGTLNIERICNAAQCVGIAQAALDASVAYANQRVQFGQRIGTFQALRHAMADMATRIHAARLMTYHAAVLHRDGVRCEREAAMAKLYASEMAMAVTHKAVQILGGMGYSMESDVQRHFRDAKLFEIGGGTSEIQRDFIAARIGLPA